MKTVARQTFRACSKLFSRKTPNDVAEVPPSNIELAAQINNVQFMSSPSIPAIVHTLRGTAKDRPGHGGGWLLSGIICINILILGCALVSGSAFNSVAITAVHRQIFLIILLLLTMLWMFFYEVFTSRKDPSPMIRDSHAGPVWLRGGLVVFGLLGLLMDILKIGNYVGYLHCDSAVKVALPVVQAVFLCAQTYFLWTHAKDCVQRHANLSKCGLALTISTNLVVWMAAVTEESLHQTDIPNMNVNISHKIYRASYGDKKCACSHSACDTFKEAFYYLYPFNIEYSLFASALAYVMWRNVGRVVEEHSPHRAKFCLKGVRFGAMTGLLLLVAGLVTFILYEVDILKEDEEKRNKALLIHFVFNIVTEALMSVTTVLGCVVYRLDQRGRVSEENPTRSLDVGLLVGASMGQFTISYFTIVAVVASGAKGYLNVLDLTWAVLTVLHLGLQNFFIIEGLHREPFHVTQKAALRTNPSLERREMTLVRESRLKVDSCPEKPSWKRIVLKEVCAFLLLANIILWIMPAFGARPQFDHYVEIYFYKYTMWTAIVNIGLPFGIFYRMHCIASLFEVYLIT